MSRPSLRPSLLGALTLLSALALLAPGCLNTGAISCGGDGFCPPGTVCTPEQDPPVCVPARGCGNGEVDDAAGEVCDDGNIKDGDGCNSTCTSEEVCGNRFVDVQLDEPEECDAGEETSVCDDDCTRPECGDEHVNREAGEVCDDGNTEPGDGCDEKCKSEECGNGITEEAFGEECDDGKHCENGDECRDDSDCEGIDDEVCKPRSNDDCSADCQNESCGNGKVDPGEGCDERPNSDAIDNHNDACIVLSSTQCFKATCGDGFVWTEDCDDTCEDCKNKCEDCDDAGESAECNRDCTVAECGDGKINRTAGEQCDDSGESPDCDKDCTRTRCGDGYTNEEAGEQCDDGGVDTATCNKDCTFAKCHDSYVNVAAGEECDTAVPTSFCNDSCKLTDCGDGVTDIGEQCDTSGQSATCNFNCSNAMCGDGIVNASFVVDPFHNDDTTAGEQCDPGTGPTGSLQRASASSPACDRDCTFARCGDGYENGLAGEDCDDVYVASGPKPHTSSCDADCTTPKCGDGTVNPEFEVDLLEDTSTLPGEQCDPGTGTTGNNKRATSDTATCNRDCSVPRCGDAYVNAAAGEVCDDVFVSDGPKPNRADCDSDCTRPACGDGIRNSSFEIDLFSDDAPESNCPGFPCITEQCDPDSGTTSNAQRALDDGQYCDADCSAVRCGDDHINAIAGEECEHPYRSQFDPAPGDTASCYANCTIPRCGDGRIFSHVISEQCDPNTGGTSDRAFAAANSADCDLDCTTPQCGDGIRNTAYGETCDDGNTDNDDDCVNVAGVCKVATCGDGHVHAEDEECDDGNKVDNDGCRNDCTLPD